MGRVEGRSVRRDVRTDRRYAYNKKLVPSGEMPKTHAELVRFLDERPAASRHRLASYDPAVPGWVTCCIPKIWKPIR